MRLMPLLFAGSLGAFIGAGVSPWIEEWSARAPQAPYNILSARGKNSEGVHKRCRSWLLCCAAMSQQARHVSPGALNDRSASLRSPADGVAARNRPGSEE